jgi:NADPH-dependent 2,4-dienoyl-CoA reductase/sulfur reductase-like enzyme
VNKVVIVGASMGGLRTAEALRRFAFPNGITIVGAERHLPYNRPPLSKDLLAHDKELAAVSFPIRSEELKADFILGDAAKSLDVAEKKVSLESGRELAYDYLVAATGLRSREMTFPNNLSEGRFSLRTYDDAKALRAAVAPGKKVVILGAGFIGLELAATLTKLGSSVDIVAIEEIPLAAILGEDFGREVQRRHELEGVKFHLGTSVKDLVGSDRVEGVLLPDGSTIDCEIFIEAVGSKPNVEWLEGNDLDLSNGLLTDQTLRAMRIDGSSIDDFFAVGDIARFPYTAQSLPARRIEHWNIPLETAKRFPHR